MIVPVQVPVPVRYCDELSRRVDDNELS